MARTRKRRAPATPAQRRRMIIIGALLVAFACFTMLYETVIYEGGRLLALVIVLAVLFCVFILPIIGTVRAARRKA
jgi:uncharacterized membrane protein